MIHGTVREYFKEVSIETETIVATIEKAQGCDLKKSKPVGFRVLIQGIDSNPDQFPDRNPGRNPETFWNGGFDQGCNQGCNSIRNPESQPSFESKP